MDEALNVDGKKYISSRRAAEISGYSMDYIGQLSRAGLLGSKMVGQHRLVDLDSLVAYVNSPLSKKQTVDSEHRHVLENLKNEAGDANSFLPKLNKRIDVVKSSVVKEGQRTYFNFSQSSMVTAMVVTGFLASVISVMSFPYKAKVAVQKYFDGSANIISNVSGKVASLKMDLSEVVTSADNLQKKSQEIFNTGAQKSFDTLANASSAFSFSIPKIKAPTFDFVANFADLYAGSSEAIVAGLETETKQIENLGNAIVALSLPEVSIAGLTSPFIYTAEKFAGIIDVISSGLSYHTDNIQSLRASLTSMSVPEFSSVSFVAFFGTPKGSSDFISSLREAKKLSSNNAFSKIESIYDSYQTALNSGLANFYNEIDGSGEKTASVVMSVPSLPSLVLAYVSGSDFIGSLSKGFSLAKEHSEEGLRYNSATALSSIYSVYDSYISFWQDAISGYLAIGEWGHNFSEVSLNYLYDLPTSLLIKGGFMAEETVEKSGEAIAMLSDTSKDLSKNVALSISGGGDAVALGINEFSVNFYDGVNNFFNFKKKLQTWLALRDSDSIAGENTQNTVEEKPVATTTDTRPIIVEGPKTIIENIRERVIVSEGVSAELLSARLEELNNKLSSEIYKISSSTGGAITNVYQTVALSNKIDSLSSVDITSSNISGSTITTSSFSGTSGIFTGNVTAGDFATAGQVVVTGTATSTFPTISVTGRLYGANGNAGANGYVLQSTGTGANWVATSTLGISGGGSSTFIALTDTDQSALTANRILHTNSGGTGLTDTAGFVFNGTNLGVGTSSPYARLSVVGSSGVVAAKFHATSTTATSTFAGGLTTGTSGLNVLVGGRVGIGTIAPASKLSVSAGASFGTSYTSIAAPTNGLIVEGNVGIGKSSASTRLDVAYSGTATLDVATITKGDSNDQGTTLVLNSATVASSAYNFLEAISDYDGTPRTQFILRGDGNMGIGTTSPYAKLSVVGSSGVVAAKFHATSTSATSTFAGGLTTGTSGLNVLVGGKVGIGTTSPSAALSVQSPSASTVGLIVKGAASQTANLFSAQDVSGVSRFGVSPTEVVFRNTSGTAMFTYTLSNGTLVNQGTINATGYYVMGNYRLDTWGAMVGAAATMGSGATIGWSSNALWYNAANDTALSRVSAGVVGVGTGAAGSTAGTLLANKIGIGTSTPYAALSVVGSSGVVAAKFHATSTSATSTFARGLTSGSLGAFGWTSTTNGSGAVDTAISRISANVIAVGNGTSADTSGELRLTTLRFADGSGTTHTFANRNSSTVSLANAVLNATGFETSGDESKFLADRLAFGMSGKVDWTSGGRYNQGSVDTSLSRISAGVVGIGTGAQGSIAGTLLANKIGIGTTSPYAALSVVGSSGVVAAKFHATSTSATSTFAGAFTAGGSSGLTVLANGKVGIGTAAPSDILSINGAANAQWLSLQYANSEYIKFGQGVIGYGMFAGSVYGSNEGKGYGINSGLPYINGNLSIGTGSAAFVDFDVGSNTTAVFSIPSVGLTTKPGILINMATSQTASPFEVKNSVAASVFKVAGAGNIGIGTTSPWRKLSVNGKAAFTGLTNDGTGYYVCLNSTTYDLATSTTACGASSERFKENINPLSYGLETILKLDPVSFDWKKDFLKNGTPQIGFIAEKVELLIPEIIGHDDQGRVMNLDYSKITAVLTKAMQELNKKFEDMKSGFMSGITEFKEIVVAKLTSGEVKTDKLCIGNTCVTEEQLQSLLAGSGASGSSATPPPDQAPAGDHAGNTAPPTVTIHGDNPAVIETDTSYMDLGALAKDSLGHELSYKIYVDGVEVSTVSIDTSSVATYTIKYEAIDSDGNTASATRTVEVIFPEPPASTTSPEPEPSPEPSPEPEI